MERVSDKKRILLISMSVEEGGSFADIFACKELPPIEELRKGYWQEIYDMVYNDSQSENPTFTEDSVKVERDEEGIEKYSCFDVAYNRERMLANAYSEDEESQINIRSDVEVCIIFPDWSVKDLTVCIDGKPKFKAHGDKKVNSKYIGAFCVTPSTGELYNTADEVAEFKKL